jgi:hypothetical protein
VPSAVRIDLVVNNTKLGGEPLHALNYKGYDFEMELSKGDVRIKGMVKLISSNVGSSNSVPGIK